MNRHALIAFVASMGIGVSLLNLTPVLPLLRESYGVSNARMGMLVTALLLSHCFVQVPAGLIVDKLGVRWSLALALGLGFMGNSLCALHQAYGFILAMRIVAGMGTGFLFVAGLKYATVHTPTPHKWLVQGVFGGLVNTGSILPFLASPFLIAYNWRFVFLFTALFFLVPLAAVVLWGEDHLTSQSKLIDPLRSLYKVGRIWALGFSHAIFFGGMMTIGTWISSYLLATNPGDSWLRTAGFIGALVIGISALGRFLGGFLIRRIQPQRLIWRALFVLAFSYTLLGFSQYLVFSVILFVLAALTNTITFSAVFSLAYRLAPSHLAGTAIALVNFIASLGALVFPILFGYLLDLTQTFTYPFLYLAALAALALAPGYSLRRETSPAVFDSPGFTN